MKKKLFTVQLGVVLSLSLLFGACGDTTTSPSDTPKAGTSPTGSANKEKTDVSWFLNVGVVPSTWDENQYVMKTITEKTNVTVSATTPADDSDTKLNLMIVNGDLPDIITLSNQTLIKQMIEADLVWNMEEFFQTYLPDSHLINGGFPNDIREKLEARDGGWYALPSHILSPENRKIWGLNPATEELWLSTDYRENRGIILNRTLMDQLGITEDDVKTESGLLEAFEKVKQANLSVNDASVITLLPNGKKFQGPSWKSDGGAVGTLAMMFGGMPVDEQGNYRSLYYNEPFKHAVSFLNKCAQLGYIDANSFTMDDAAIEAACRSGRVFGFIGNTANTGFAFEGVWYTPGVVLSEGGETPVLGKNSTVGRGWLQTFVSKNTKNPEATAKFLDFMTSEEGLTQWIYGEKDVDYTINGDGLYIRTEEGTQKFNNSGVTGLGAFWAFANQNFDQKYMDPSFDKGIEPQCAFGLNEATYKYDSAALDELPGSYIESNQEMLAISTEIQSYVGTQLANIILQATDSNFDTLYSEMLQQLEKLGLKDLDAYVNDAVQENYKRLGYTLKHVN